ncbi:MAG: peptidylprolyl isomerase, partial [Acidobacteriota bacterium]
SVAEMQGKQAVVETSAGTIVIQLFPEAAPNHVGLFMKLVREGTYAGTVFHSVIRNGIIVGGDPISRDPTKAALYGTGNVTRLKAEPDVEPHVEGSISAMLAPGDRDSAGEQFFICATDQPGLTGQYDVFGRVVDGIEVVQQISTVEADADGHPKARIEIKSIAIRDTPPDPFMADSADALASYRAIVETTMGIITFELLPDKAPETVRSFLRLAQAGVYDGIRVHRVARNFVVQMGALQYRDRPLTRSQQRFVHELPPEFNDTAHVPGVVSMAHGDDPGSALTSFFVCTGECRALDGKYTAFARVVGSLDALNAIAAVPVDGESPVSTILVTRIRVEKK